MHFDNSTYEVQKHVNIGFLMETGQSSEVFDDRSANKLWTGARISARFLCPSSPRDGGNSQTKKGIKKKLWKYENEKYRSIKKSFWKKEEQNNILVTNSQWKRAKITRLQ